MAISEGFPTFFIEHEPICNRLHHVPNIVDCTGQVMDVFSVDWRDDGLIQLPCDVVGDLSPPCSIFLMRLAFSTGSVKSSIMFLSGGVPFDHVVRCLAKQIQKASSQGIKLNIPTHC